MGTTIDQIENTVTTNGSGLLNEIDEISIPSPSGGSNIANKDYVDSAVASSSSLVLSGANGLIDGTVILNGSNQPEITGTIIGAKDKTGGTFNNFTETLTNEAYTTALPAGDSWLVRDSLGVFDVTAYKPQLSGKNAIDFPNSDYYKKSTNQWFNSSDVAYTDGRCYINKNSSGDGANNVSTTDAVPTMTSNTSPNGIALASGEFTPTLAAWKAFDDTNATGDDAWVHNVTTDAWIQYKFDTAISINKYALASRLGESDQMVKDWTIQASNTGAFGGEEIILDTITGETSWVHGTTRYFSFINTTPYIYYRLKSTAQNGDTTYTSIAEFELIESQTAPTLTQLEYTQLSNNITANEFKGKNACTAWVNFDGTTTPPTIRDSFNVSDVARTSTGVFEITFSSPMDNINYTFSIGTSYPFATSGTKGVDDITDMGTDILKISTANFNGSASNDLMTTVMIFGGKN